MQWSRRRGGISQFNRTCPDPSSIARAIAPVMEPIEQRVLLATLTVTTLADGALGATAGDGELTLREAIEAANNNSTIDGQTGSGSDTIAFDSDLAGGTIELSVIGDTTAGPSAFLIESTITIRGLIGDDGISITRDNGADNMRLFYIDSGGALTLRRLTLSGGRARGGDGGDGGTGGGGGAGLGGAIYNEGNLTIEESTFTNNIARGGDGGDGEVAAFGGGGGGGFSGDGGDGAGGAVGNQNPGGGGGGTSGAGDNGVTASSGGDGGSGGSGGTDGEDGSGTDGGASSGAGGGGGGTGANAGDGGNGGTGGGGGGGGGGNFSADGGDGGFGGGGGGTGGGDVNPNGDGGFGGFGGGGGGGAPGATGDGGFGAGDGGDTGSFGGGGGGAAMGGAIFNESGTVSITNSTFVGNSALNGAAGNNGATAGTGLGGAIFNYNGDVTIVNSTLANNTSDNGGAIYNLAFGNDADLTLSNSIAANSVAVEDVLNHEVDNTATADVDDPNIIESLTNTGGTVTDTFINDDPVLSALADNGGPTQTMEIQAGSPAINGGTSSGAPELDQRGLERDSNVDIGAYERDAVVPNDAPTFTSIPDTSATTLEAYTYFIATDDNEGDDVTITAEELPDWLDFEDDGDGTATLSGTALVGDVGSHNVVLRVSDGLEFTEQEFTIEVVEADPNDAPTFTSNEETDATQGQAYTYNITTDDDDNDDVTITAPELPNWLDFEDNGDGTATLTGTPDAGDVGQHDVTLRVSDGEDFTEQEFTITVAAIGQNNAPTFSSNEETDATQGQAYTYNITTDDDDNDDVTITAPELPNWLDFEDNGDGTATLTGTPDAGDVGQHSVTLRVSDGEDFTEQEFTITVAAIDENDAPTFTSNEETDATQGQAYTYNITTDDEDNDDVTITAPELPNWLDFEDNGDGTATLTGTPGSGDVGQHDVTLRVSDGEDFTEQTFTITVVSAGGNHAPVADNFGVTRAPAELHEIDALNNASDEDDDDLTLTITVQPKHGQAQIDNKGTPGDLSDDFVVYTPDVNYFGPDSFTYRVSDGQANETGVITITIFGAGLVPNPVIPELDDLVVVGGEEADNFLLRHDDDEILVRINDQTQGRFEQTGEILVFGGKGNDKIDADALTLSVNLYGQSGDDTVRGSSRADTILGGKGNDVLRGLDGEDELSGNSGRDDLFGGDDADVLLGGTGADDLFGGKGIDELYGNSGNDDFFTRSSTRDSLFGGKGEDEADADDKDILKSIEGELA